MPKFGGKTLLQALYSVKNSFNTGEPIKPLPPHYQWIATDDGSETLYSEKFQEACHSTTGARAETQLHYLEGCRIVERALSTNSFTILEVGLGLGIGVLTTLENIASLETQFHMITLEIDSELVHWVVTTLSQHVSMPELKMTEKNGFQVLNGKKNNFEITIIIGDARKSLPAYLKDSDIQWNAIYQDAFSPKRNPVLWTLEWFELLKKHANQDVILSTYSASSSIRKSLIAAGWSLQKGEKFGPKRASTRANLSGVSDEDILLQLSRSPVEALRD